MSYDSDNHIPYILGLTEAMDEKEQVIRYNENIKVNSDGTISPRDPRKPSSYTTGTTAGSDVAVERPEADTKVTQIRHSTLKHLICILTKHTWTNDTTYPTYGYHDTPYPGSYCKKCGQQA